MPVSKQLEAESEHAEWASFHSYWGWICRECEASEGWAKLDGRDHGHGCSWQPIVLQPIVLR
jgi:hypothetical protein